MSPKITISKGERILEDIEIGEQEALNLANILQESLSDRLTTMFIGQREIKDPIPGPLLEVVRGLQKAGKTAE